MSNMDDVAAAVDSTVSFFKWKTATEIANEINENKYIEVNVTVSQVSRVLAKMSKVRKGEDPDVLQKGRKYKYENGSMD